MTKLLLLPLCAFAALAAADSFWEAKPFATWSDAETRLLMSNSPWAHEVALTDPAAAGWQTSGRVGGGKGGRGAIDIPTAAASAKIKAVVIWESALPARQAVARIRFGAEAADSRDAKALLEPFDTYAIVVSGVPAAWVKQDVAKINETLAAKTALAMKGHPPQKPTKAEAVANGPQLGIYFEFPRTFAIGPTDKDVDFSTRIGDLDLKTTFHPADMLVAGKLEL